jgi:SOS-response transcriptional repressor LexA
MTACCPPAIAAILDYIRAYRAANGYPPTVREIQAELGHSSTSITQRWLEQARMRGLLTWKDRCPRTYREVVS